MSAPSTNKVRRFVLTGAVAAITATGTWYGAGLKTQQERNHDKNAILEASAEQQLEQMETLRGQLTTRRDELQTKIDQLTMERSDAARSAYGVVDAAKLPLADIAKEHTSALQAAVSAPETNITPCLMEQAIPPASEDAGVGVNRTI
ncbi:hypothetical protein Q7P37_011489 [Cladosporium fusiforme]